MASSQTLTTLFFFFSIVINVSYAATQPKPTAFYFPIRKNQTTLQYYVTTKVGSSNISVVDALLDLGGPSVWFECTSYFSSSYKPASCGSNRCKKAYASTCVDCNSFPTPVRPGCSNTTCAVYAFDRNRQYFTAQELGEDTMLVYSTGGRYVGNTSFAVPKFQFSCAHALTTEGLPGDHTKGSAGFARTRMSLPSQISSSFNLPPKFALCLPSSTQHGLGDVFIGGGPYYMPPRTADQALSLVRTPLLVNPVGIEPFYFEGYPSNDYFISVKGIEVSGKRLALNSSLLSFDKNGVGGTKITTVAPYTTLHPSIYERLVEDFTKAAARNNIKRVKSVAPFGACFDSKTAPKTVTGPGVPDIDLLLEGNINPVRLRLYGSNSMVEAKKNVICLAFIYGGAEPATSIVLGGHQLEDRLLEFDLSTSKLGFTSSLLLSNSSCSNSRVY